MTALRPSCTPPVVNAASQHRGSLVAGPGVCAILPPSRFSLIRRCPSCHHAASIRAAIRIGPQRMDCDKCGHQWTGNIRAAELPKEEPIVI
jgi:hypothetical protein